MVLKTTTFAVLLAATQAKADSIHNRKLSLEDISSYPPVTVVTDSNAIDLDQILMETALVNATEDAFEIAREVYENGANVGSYALLKLQTNELPVMTLGESVAGTSVNGASVTGTLDEVPPTSSATGEIEIKVLYDVSEIQANYLGCRVGGHPDPVTGGCFEAAGEVTIGTLGTWTYTYVVGEDNKNLVSIQGFSTNANLTMKPADSDEYFVHFQKFVDYYGTPTYANEWIVGALNGTETSFSRGNADFRNETYEARAQSVAVATVNIVIASNVIRELETAIYDCLSCATDDCADEAINSLDKAVAFYTGSSEGTDFTDGTGYLMYRYADLRCSQFKTCGENSDLDTGVSYVNRQVFEQFRSMQRNLIAEDCNAAIVNKERIVQLLNIPIIQSTLKYAYMKCYDEEETDNVDVLEGATYAAAILPMLAACNSDAASTLCNNMQQGKNDTSYSAVRSAFESQYDCLGITCEDVGGIWNGSEYSIGGSPCGITDTTGDKSKPFWEGIQVVFYGALAVIFFVCGMFF